MQEGRSFFDKVFIVCVGIAAVFMAFQQALSSSPKVQAVVPIDLSGLWNYFPLAVLSLGAGAWAAGRFSRPNRHTVEAINLIQKASADLAKSKAQREAPKPPGNPGDRVILDHHITPKLLDSVIKGKTSVEARLLLQPYFDKWMRTTGEVLNLMHADEQDIFVVVMALYGSEYSQRIMSIDFAKSQNDRASILRAGDMVSFVAKVHWSSVDWSISEAEISAISPSAGAPQSVAL